MDGNELVVVKLRFHSHSARDRDVFVYNDSSGSKGDIQLLAPGDGLLARLIKYECDVEKFFWCESFIPKEGLLREVMVMVKTLVDSGAVEGRGASLNVNSSDEASLTALKELERLGAVIGKQSGSDITSWLLRETFANQMEPVTRLHSHSFALDAPCTTSDSVVSLVAVLERDGWEHKVWDDRAEPPPPVNIARCRPKSFYSKASSSSLMLSKWYVKALLSTDKITCCDEIANFETDEHYRNLLAGGPRAKRRRLMAMQDDVADLAALLDDKPRRARGRGSGGTHRGGGGGQVGRVRKGDDRTFPWGSSLITISVKKDGTEVVQGTCHRKHSHPHAPGKPSTSCRTTYSVTGAHSLEDCTILVKLWISRAGFFTNRLAHQKRRYALDEVPDNLEDNKPPSDYDTSSEVEDGAAAAPARRPVVKPKLRLRKKAAGVENNK